MKYTIEYVPGAGTYTAHRDGVRMEITEIVDLLNQHEELLAAAKEIIYEDGVTYWITTDVEAIGRLVEIIKRIEEETQ